MNECSTAVVGVCDAVQLDSQSLSGGLKYLIPCGRSVQVLLPAERSVGEREAWLPDLRSTSFHAKDIRLFVDRFYAASVLPQQICHLSPQQAWFFPMYSGKRR